MTRSAVSANPRQGNGSASCSSAFTNVLCGIDDSRPSAEAARQVSLLASPGGSVEFVAVCWTLGEGRHAMSNLNPERARRALEEARSEAVAAGASAELRILRTPGPATALIESAQGHDLVAVGSHTGSRAGGIFFGSTASTLVHSAPAPVLVARRPPGDGKFPGKVALATDGSEGSAAAALLAGLICRDHGSELTIVHVDGDLGASKGEEIERQRATLRENLGRDPAYCSPSGAAHEEILRIVSELGAGLLVVGSRGLGGAMALGSVSERVAQRSPCSVLVVRPDA